MINMTMDRHRRLKLILTVVLFTLHATPIKTETNTNFVTNNSIPKQEFSDGLQLTKDDRNDENMTMAPLTNTPALWSSTTTRFPLQQKSLGSDPTIKEGHHRNDSNILTTGSNKPVVNSDSVLISTIKMANATNSVLNFFQRFSGTDKLTLNGVTTDLNNIINNTTVSGLRTTQRFTSPDVSNSQMFTEARSISNTSFKKIITHEAVNTTTGNLITITSDPLYDRCHQYGGCDSVPGPLWYCQCDDLCVEYKDCCKDYTFNNKVMNQKYTCVGIKEDTSFNWGIQAVSVCPDVFTNRTIISLCTDGLLRSVGPPVLDINDKSRVYRNKYCALCHSVDAISLDIALTLNPSIFGDIDGVVNLTEVEFQQDVLGVAKYTLIISENAKMRYCITQSRTNDDYLCNLYSNPILVVRKGHLFRNSYCMETSYDELDTRCMHEFMDRMESSFWRSSVLTSRLTILFSFNQRADPKTQDKCQIWSEENNKDCSHLPKYINAQISLNYNIRLPTNVTNLEIMQSVLLTLIAKQVDDFSTVSLPYQLGGDEEVTVVNVQLDCRILKTVFGHELSTIKKRINDQTVVISEKNKKGRHFMTTNERDHVIIFNKTIQFFGESDLILKNRSGFYLHFGVPDLVSTELCDKVKLDVTRLPTDYLSIITMDCTSDLLLQRQTSYLPILTCVFSGVSCVSLIVMIVFNRLHHLHSEIPFANLENISLSSIFSSILLSVGQIAPYINTRVCYTIGVISHYSWLLVFSFKSLAVLYIVQTLMQMKCRRLDTKENKIKKRRKITGIGLLIPIFFVAPAIVVDLHGPAYFSPGFANGAFCFPVQFPGNLIFFTGPVLATIIINTVCIIQIIIRIHLAQVAARNVRQSSLLIEAKIYLRILSISGCFWITGIMAAYFKLEWLEYVFTVFCGLQGLFVAIANLTTRRTSSSSGSTQSTNKT